MSGSGATLRLVVVGHVDHGKSTLIGRLMHELGAVTATQHEAIAVASRRRGVAFEWAFLLDALQAERDQGVTIDATRVRLGLGDRDVILIDVPGHRRFLRNMLTGATEADAALVVVDAVAGMGDQTRRHCRLLQLVGIEKILLVVSKMDLTGYDRVGFETLVASVTAYLGDLALDVVAAVPVSARDGSGLMAGGVGRPSWYQGAMLTEAMGALSGREDSTSAPLRMPVQDIYRRDGERIIVGRIEAGHCACGDEVVFAPTRQRARIAAIRVWPPRSCDAAGAGQSIGIVLDREVFVERGVVMADLADPPLEARIIHASLVWLGARSLQCDRVYTLRLHTARLRVRVQHIEIALDPDTLETRIDADTLHGDEVGRVILRCETVAAFDGFDRIAATGRLVLLDGYEVVAAGTVLLSDYPATAVLSPPDNLTWTPSTISRPKREGLHGHRGGVLWFTGYSGAGKSTLAFALEALLSRGGYSVYVLDGDNMRHGLNADLGFSPADRSENIRRVREVAALFADAGMIVIAAFITPFQSDRDAARKRLGDDFHEIYIEADIETCMARDPKGLYDRALRNEIADFTGIHSPYETPYAPELTIDTVAEELEACIARLHAYVETVFKLESHDETHA